MLTRLTLGRSAIVWLTMSMSVQLVAQTTATGFVFVDANENRAFDADDRALPNIRVSNGKEIVATDENGRYQLPVRNDTTIFLIKPRGYRTPLNEHNNPLFYYTHKPGGSPASEFPGVAPTGPLPESIDFPLYAQTEPDQFKAIMFGDPQPRDQKEVDYIAHDVVEDLVGTDASFGVTLGDIVFDDLNMFGPQAHVIATLGIPWYNVIGNHDLNFDATEDRLSDETFERHFGPAYYSFDYGPVHFLVLDDVEWFIPPPEVDGEQRGKYRGGLGAEQMEFIRRDLASIPEKQLVVLMMHIPLIDVQDRQELYRLIEHRPFCMSISAHTHTHEHRYITKDDGWQGPKPHHHVVNVTVSGSWWQGAPDERKIPHATMRDGAPNGYSILLFDGEKYSMEFHAAGRPKDYQMEIFMPEVIDPAELGSTTVYANVFNASADASVEFRVNGGAWQAMQHSLQVDPLYELVYDDELDILNTFLGPDGDTSKFPWRKLYNKDAISTHLWKANLPAGLDGLCELEVRANTMDKKTHTDRRLFRVESVNAAP